MSVYTGLKKLQQAIDESGGTGGKWLKLNDGQSVKIYFLQEIDEGSKYFNEEAGQAIFVPEHNVPKQFPKKFVCTNDEGDGDCYGCQQYQENPKGGWKAKTRLYCNVLVDDGSGNEPVVAILNQGLGAKAITNGLAEFANDSGGITMIQFKMKRTGAGQNDTSYTLTPLINTDPVDASKYELFNLEEVAIKKVPFEEQEEYVRGSAEEKNPAAAAATNANDDW